MALPSIVETAAASWSAYYSKHQLVSVSVRYLHLAATMVGGGAALALDRQVLGAIRGDATARGRLLQQLTGSHPAIVTALTLLAVTGVLMTAADLDTFLDSTLYRVKLLCVAALVVNGGALLRLERSMTASPTGPWRGMATVAALSMVLWLVTLFVGTWLTVAA